MCDETRGRGVYSENPISLEVVTYTHLMKLEAGTTTEFGDTEQ